MAKKTQPTVKKDVHKEAVVLPKELFGGKANPQLVAQAIRVYLANQREGAASTKTRGQVEGSTRKIYRQKGTGKARHGSIRAPIFVGGGIVFGPKPRDYRLTLTKKMKRVALLSSLYVKKAHTIIAPELDAVDGKTKQVWAILKKLGADDKVLLVVAKETPQLKKAAKNIACVDCTDVASLNPYSVMMHKTIIFSQKSIDESVSYFGKNV